MVVVSDASDARSALRALQDSSPDAAILSVQIPGNIVQLVGAMASTAPSAEILVLADEPDDELMLQLVVAGARGFLLGETNPERLPFAIAGMLAGEAAFPRRLVRVLADEVARTARRRAVAGDDGPALTAREVEVLELLGDGRPARDVARRLGTSEATVRSHAANAARKLGVASRAEAVERLRRRDHPRGGTGA